MADQPLKKQRVRGGRGRGSGERGCLGTGRSGGHKPWAQEREDRKQYLKPGPSNERELYNYGSTNIRSLIQDGEDAEKDQEIALQLQTHLLRGTEFNDEYSGMGCTREAVEAGVRGYIEVTDPPWKSEIKITWGHSCDVGDMQLDVLTKIAKETDDSKSCVLNNMFSRLDKSAAQFVEASRPLAPASRDEKEKAHKDIEDWLHANREWALPANATSPCLVHDRRCPSSRYAYWLHYQGQDRDTLSTAEQANLKMCDQCGYDANPRPMICTAGGVVCTPVTAMGLSEKAAHEADVTHSVFTAEREVLADRKAEDLFFVECTERYDWIVKLRIRLKNTHRIVAVLTASQYHGHPDKRKRRLCAGLAGTADWMGPESDIEIQEDFERRFHRGTLLNADVYMLNSEGELIEIMINMARVQKNMITADEIKRTKISDLLGLILPPGAAQRVMNEWLPIAQGEPEGFLWADVGHHPNSKGGAWGKDFPVLLQHSLIMRIPSDLDVPLAASGLYIASGLDHLASLGFVVHPENEQYAPLSRAANIIQQLHPGDTKKLAGNGQCLCTESAWAFYVLGNTKFKLDDKAEEESGASNMAETGMNNDDLFA